MTALALRDDQSYWDDTQLAVLRSSGIDDDVTKPELQAFLHECQRRKLDPFARQIYLIGRWDREKGRKVYRSQTSIDGFRVIARRAADEARETVEYDDTLWCGPDGQWTDIWLSPEPPAACKVVVLRDGKRFPATARYTSYAVLSAKGEPVGLWRKMADSQLAKCTEALALRKAFPEDLGGLYTDDEMQQADGPAPGPVTAEVVRETRADAITAGGDDPWAAPGPSPARSEADPAWLENLRMRALTATEQNYRALWSELGDGWRAGKCSTAERKDAEMLIQARVDDLRRPPADDAEVVEGVIVGLEPEDDWYAKVESVTSDDDAEAAIANVAASVRAGSMPRARGDQIIAAIRARQASLVAA